MSVRAFIEGKEPYTDEDMRIIQDGLEFYYDFFPTEISDLSERAEISLRIANTIRKVKADIND